MNINSKIPKNKTVSKYTFLLRHSSGLLRELVSVPVFTKKRNSKLNLLKFFVFSICKNISIAIYERI